MFGRWGRSIIRPLSASTYTGEHNTRESGHTSVLRLGLEAVEGHALHIYRYLVSLVIDITNWHESRAKLILF
jgi:hypothetical protein